MDCSPPGSSVHGILQEKNTGEGCHALSSRGSSQPKDQTQVSCIAGASLLSELPGTRKKTGVGSWSLLHSLCYRIIKKKESQAQSFPTTQEILSFSRVLSIEKLIVYAGSDIPGFLPGAWGIRVPAYLKPLTLRENINL